MNENQTFILGIIVACFGFICTIVSLILTYKLNKIHKQFNSMMDRLIKTSSDKAHAEGVKEEKERTEE